MGLSKLGGSVNNKLKQGKKGAHLSMGYGKEGRELTYQWVTTRKEVEISHKWVTARKEGGISHKWVTARKEGAHLSMGYGKEGRGNQS